MSEEFQSELEPLEREQLGALVKASSDSAIAHDLAISRHTLLKLLGGLKAHRHIVSHVQSALKKRREKDAKKESEAS